MLAATARASIFVPFIVEVVEFVALLIDSSPFGVSIFVPFIVEVVEFEYSKLVELVGTGSDDAKSLLK